MTPKKIIYIVLGCLCLALGVIGIYLPILPTTPFLLATLFFFANSSEKLHAWFLGTKLYKKHLESFVKKEGMRMQTKVSIITMVTLLMGFGFFMMARKAIWVPCIILAVAWLAHIVYFGFFVKTIPSEGDASVEEVPEEQTSKESNPEEQPSKESNPEEQTSKGSNPEEQTSKENTPDDQPTDTQPAEEQSDIDQSTDAQPAEEQSDIDQSTDDRPADNQTTDDQPTA